MGSRSNLLLKGNASKDIEIIEEARRKGYLY